MTNILKSIIFTTIFLFFITKINFKNYNKEIEKVQQIKGDFNKNYAILIDYSKHNGLKRGFIVNLKTSTIEKKFLVRNGKNNLFSNKIGSNNTSLGIAFTNGRGRSKFGNNVKYVLEGISEGNCNIKKRNVVLHSSSYFLPEFETYPFKILTSKGCPTVSISTMKYLDKLIKRQKNKKIIIYSFI